jgi:hypothetical protein
VKLVLIVRGLAKARRQAFIDEIKETYEVDDFVQIDTPAPKDKVDKEVLKAMNVESFNAFKGAVALGKELIIVNNANVKRYHYFQYLDYAQMHDYLAVVAIVPWNDMSDRELVSDGGNEKPAAIYKKYRSEFQWEI